jgi:hypothetical protein
MNPDQLPDLYLRAAVARHRIDASPDSAAFRIRERLLPALTRWAGPNLESVSFSGSFAKNTAIRGPSLLPGEFDVDLFVSLSPAFGNLDEMHSSLIAELRQFNPVPRNVATRIYMDGLSVDLVPGRRRAGSPDHSLWQLRSSTWIQTNIPEQIRYVRDSGCMDDILALKIWRPPSRSESSWISPRTSRHPRALGQLGCLAIRPLPPCPSLAFGELSRCPPRRSGKLE